MKVKRVEHIAIAVSSLKASIDFMRDTFGLPLEYEEQIGHTRLAMLPVGETYVELLEGQGPESGVTRWIGEKGPGLFHICFEGDTVTEVTGSPFTGHARTQVTHRLSAVKLLVPVIPPTFYAAGINYREHVTEWAKAKGVEPEFPPQADVGYRANNALIATDEAIVIPKDATDQVQYEGELVVVIGKQCKRVSEAQALDCVFGYTIGNDVSERTWQGGDRTLWR